MPELTDAQKVMRNDTGKSIAEAIANMSITVAGQEVEVSDTEPQSKFVDVWFQEQQQGTPVEVYTVPEVDAMRTQMESNLAYINTGATADKLYNPGEYLVYNGQLYKVTASTISQGQTLNPNQDGNIKAVSVGDMMTPVVKALGYGSAYNDIVQTLYAASVFKIGAICFVQFTFDTKSIPAEFGWKEIFTLPYSASENVSTYIVTRARIATQIGVYQNIVRINNPNRAIEVGDAISVVLPYITTDY